MDQGKNSLSIKIYGSEHTKPAPSKCKTEEEETPIIITVLVRNPNTGRSLQCEREGGRRLHLPILLRY